ncbi:MAG: DUF3566 domain-containing protein [Frankia sp.]|nr:DUF3566 domain-containing protein [Frankia sp.]
MPTPGPGRPVGQAPVPPPGPAATPPGPPRASRRERRERPEPERYEPPVDEPAARPGRQARLRLTRISPLSVTKLAFAFSLCIFLVVMVAVAVLWFVLNSVGVFDSIVDAAGTLTDGDNDNISTWLSFGRAMQISLLVGATNVILITVLATLAAMLYNLCSDMIGGVEVTLSDQ